MYFLLFWLSYCGSIIYGLSPYGNKILFKYMFPLSYHVHYVFPLTLPLLYWSSFYEITLLAFIIYIYIKYIKRLRNFISKNYKTWFGCHKDFYGYFCPRRVIKSSNFNGQCIYSIHPHGTWSLGGYHIITDDEIINRKVKPTIVISDAILNFPVAGDLLAFSGAQSCSRANIIKLLNEGKSVAIYLGGEQELMVSTPGKDIIDISKRNGIFDMAREYKIPIIPLLCYNETDMYHNFNNIPIRKMLKKITGSVLQFTFGDKYLPYMPRKNITLEFAVGDPVFPSVNFKNDFIEEVKRIRKNHPPSDINRYFEIIS